MGCVFAGLEANKTNFELKISIGMDYAKLNNHDI